MITVWTCCTLAFISTKLECQLCTVGGEHREEIGVLFLFDNIFEPRLGAALGQWGIGSTGGSPTDSDPMESE